MRQKLFDHIKKKYKVKPEYPWRKYPDYAVLRHSDNNKWFALVAEVERTRLGLPGDEYVPIVNLKVDDLMFRDMLINPPTEEVDHSCQSEVLRYCSCL